MKPVTLITGASGGIGEAFARRLAREGHDLVLTARSEEKLQRLCRELADDHGVDCRFIAADLADPQAVRRVYEESAGRGVEVDQLINNAGFGSMGDFVELDLEREVAMVDLNIRALVALTHLFLPGMRERGRGTIINVSSAAGFQPIPFMATYAASKAFVTSFTEAIAEENRPFGIEVLALCPGSTRTNFHVAAHIDTELSFKGMQTPEQVVETALKAVKARRARVISGWTNWLVAAGANLVPNSLITRGIAKSLRGRFQKGRA